MSFSKVVLRPKMWLVGLLVALSLWSSHDRDMLSAQLLTGIHVPAVVADGGVITPPPG